MLLSLNPTDCIIAGQGYIVFVNLPSITMINDLNQVSIKAKIWDVKFGESMAYGEAEGELQLNSSNIILRDLVVTIKDHSSHKRTGTMIVTFRAIKK